MHKPFLVLLACCSFVSISAADPPTVLVAPFDETGAARHPWIGATLHRGLLAELAHDASAKAVVPPVGVQLTPDDAAIVAAVDAGKAAGASYVVVGRYEMAPQGLIVNGRTIRVPGGESAGRIDVIGRPRDLFLVQSKVAEQVKAALGAAAPARQQRGHRIDAPVAPQDVAAPVLYSDSDRDPALNLATEVAIQRAMQRQRRNDDTELTLRPSVEAQLHRSGIDALHDRADDKRTAVERAPVERTPTEPTDAPRFGNAISGGGGNSMGGTGNTMGSGGNTMGGSGHTMGGGGNTTAADGNADRSGLNITGSPGNVMTGGSGSIFLEGPGNFINGGAGNQIIVPAHMAQRPIPYPHTMGITDAHVMQGGDGNYILPGAGITIRQGSGNTAGGISGNHVGSAPGNTATSSSGNTNSR